MISVGDDYSRELCGGTHLHSTGEIGLFHILSESSVGAGLRRIEAVTGRGAEAYVKQQLNTLNAAAEALQTRPTELAEKSAELMEQLRAQQREINELRSRAVRETAMSVLPKAKTLAGVQVLAASIEADSVERLREMIDLVRDGLHQAAGSQQGPVAGSVIVLGAVLNNKATLVAAVSPELVKRGLHAGKLVGDIARAIGGSGGGRPEMGQAGGGEASRIQEALDLVEPRVKGSLA